MGMIGGLPRRRPDQDYRPPAPPGPVGGSAGTLRARLVVVSGAAGTGILVYSPSVGPGNLVASVAPNAGMDLSGNHYASGFVSYFPSGPTTGSYTQINGAQIIFGTYSGAVFTDQFELQNVSGNLAIGSSGSGQVLINEFLSPATTAQLEVAGQIAATLSVLLVNRAGDPATPAAGAVIYSKAGALFARGTSGTVTMLAPA